MGGSGLGRFRLAGVGVMLVLLAFVVGAPGVGVAATHAGIGGTFDVTQVTWDLSEDSADLGPHGSPQGNDTSMSDPTCQLAPVPAPNAQYVYKILQGGSPGLIPLQAIEYDPLDMQTGDHFPLMVLLHGGGWAQGCRNSMAGVAYDFAVADTSLTYHYIVLSIDYRLACDPSDPQILGTQLAPLCGWYYNTPDPQRNNEPGAAIHDALDAVAWARNMWPTIAAASPYWNGKIALVGGSAGG
jgi:hypothetical protein